METLQNVTIHHPYSEDGPGADYATGLGIEDERASFLTDFVRSVVDRDRETNGKDGAIGVQEVLEEILKKATSFNEQAFMSFKFGQLTGLRQAVRHSPFAALLGDM